MEMERDSEGTSQTGKKIIQINFILFLWPHLQEQSFHCLAC